MAGNAVNIGPRRWGRWRIAALAVAALLLLLPLAAMQFTDEVDWTALDFVFMGALLGAVGLGAELAVRKTRNVAYRMGACAALAAAFLLIWINGAVGIIGSEQEDANLLYGGVLGVALIGATAARFRPAGMALAMSATAFAQALVPLAASTFGLSSNALVWSPEVLVISGFFVALWLISAWLFWKGALEQTSAGAT
ncbi:MAG TPA: hypothetical protein VKA79_07430 [Aestuariivirgaceae bacterium]|nr:hypothetical protein [Aestuariivirgaceae bacterium]